jgi:hypothetical protein
MATKVKVIAAGQASQAVATGWASGVYRAGCAGPNGAVVTTRPAAPHCYWSRGVKVCR